tara:strand:- start:23 stop:298 length:276 start_codon:yes stop_codon:yes gene_type:complete
MSFLRLLLFIAVFYTPLLEASHSDEIDCDEQNCLICHANTDEYEESSGHPLFLAVKPADLIFSVEDRLVDKALKANLSIRGPPRNVTGEYV